MKTCMFVAKGINISCAIIESTAYILMEDKKELLQFNDVGTYIWQQINGGNCVGDIIQNCLQGYDGDIDEISETVIDFLKMLERECLIEVSEISFEEVMYDVG
ncbi:MAG TPA: PqqD family protein [Ignavibacteria bacterium]|nr:PqqD family protein [Ignavibacteria bacterium]